MLYVFVSTDISFLKKKKIAEIALSRLVSFSITHLPLSKSQFIAWYIRLFFLYKPQVMGSYFISRMSTQCHFPARMTSFYENQISKKAREDTPSEGKILHLFLLKYTHIFEALLKDIHRDVVPLPLWPCSHPSSSLPRRPHSVSCCMAGSLIIAGR